jgi:hypothetical protein
MVAHSPNAPGVPQELPVTPIRLIAPALICAAFATPVSADVTLRLKGSGGMFGDQATDTTE